MVDPGQRSHAPADTGGARTACPPGLAQPVAGTCRPGRRSGRRGRPAVGTARLSPARSLAARRGPGPDRTSRRRRPVFLRGAAGPARCWPLYRRRGGQLRLQAAPPGSGHQRAPGDVPPGHWRGVSRPHAVGRRVAAGRVAASGRGADRSPLVGGSHGTRRAGLHRRAAALCGVPPRTRLLLAEGGTPARRRTARGAALRGDRPAVPGTAAGRAPRRGRARHSRPARRGSGRCRFNGRAPWTAWWRSASWTSCPTVHTRSRASPGGRPPGGGRECAHRFLLHFPERPAPSAFSSCGSPRR